MRHLYVDTGKLPVSLMEGLQRGKQLREDADYYDEWSEFGAEEMLNIAEEFLTKAQKIVGKIFGS